MKTKMFQLPADDYECVILQINSELDGKARRVITWILRVIGGPYDGNVIEKKFYLVNKTASDFLKKELKMLGIEPVTESDFGKMKNQAYGLQIKITASINEQGFACYYLKEVLKKEPQVAVGDQTMFVF